MTLLNVTIEYKESPGAVEPIRVHTIVISVHHAPDVPLQRIEKELMEEVVNKVIPEKYLDEGIIYHLLPSRRDEEEAVYGLETFSFYLSEPLSKERVEAFSDGVYAIVATLLILDICEDNVPDPREVGEKFHGSLLEALSEYGPNYLAYFGSFVTIGLLWFVHHSLFLYVTKTTRLMGLLNILSLAFIGGLPLAYQLTSEFAEKSHNEIEAIQVSCVITFFASIFQFAIWTTALLHERETLHPFARYGGKEHAFMFAKLALYPCVSLGAFFLTCLLSEFSTEIFHLMQIVIPFAFLALRIFVRISLTLIKSAMSLSRWKVVLLEEEEACLSPAETHP
ncbi:endosomal/lysosomal proton channel TMEM175-like [Cyrtonyx montezumae]|uniref:endosomal/lysosomal proton channel TMEM175-like n=1 Tax=Cyrtonyx montezumae TaxID=9017 RepID=UPI0032DA69F9